MTKTIPICDYCGGRHVRELTEAQRDSLPDPLATCTHFCSTCDGPVGVDEIDVSTKGEEGNG